MKKVLIVLGSIFLVLILLAALGIGFVAVRGNALDKESKAYADAAIPAIITTWLDKELLDRASPEFNQAASPLQVYQMFRSWETSLGRLKKCEPAQGQSLMSVTSQSGKTISAQYTAKAKFERGETIIRLILIKHGDQWQILRFDVDAPKLVPPNTQATFLPGAAANRITRNSVKNYMSYKPQSEKAEIAFQSGGKILTALTRFE